MENPNSPQPTNYKRIVALIVIVAVAAFGAGYSRRRVEIKEVTKIQTQIEYKDKIVEVEKKVYVRVKDKNVVITKHEVKRPDGTEVIDTVITDKTKDTTKTDDNTTKTNDMQQNTTQIVTQTKEIKTLTLPDWFVQIGAGVNLANPRLAEWPASGIYSVSVSRRLFLSCYTGIQGQSDVLFHNPTVLALVGCGIF